MSHTPSPYHEVRAGSDPEAARRAEEFRDVDPFPQIRPALLSSEHVHAYVVQTGMIHPFHPEAPRLKSASYEINPGGRFIYWDEQGKKHDIKVEESGTLTLPANSISFVQVGVTFRLPQYIAVRFNLRITHVHRGILLGTGPLVDPGFHGTLMVPLHNLTSEPYTIRSDEGLIWVEFTKTSREAGTFMVRTPKLPFNGTELRKSDQSPEYYFDRASKNMPIRSSLPIVVAEALNLSHKAAAAARRADRKNSVFVGGGLLAVAGTVIGIFAYFESIKANVIAAESLASGIGVTAAQATDEIHRLQDELKDIKGKVDAIDQASGALRVDEIRTLRSSLAAVRTEVAQLKIRVQDLSDRPQTVVVLPGK